MRRLTSTSMMVFIASMVILLAAGYWGGLAWNRRTSSAVGVWATPFTPSSAYSDAYNEFAEWALNDVARMSAPWTPEIAARLAGILNDAYSETYIDEVATRPGAAPADQEPLLRYGYAEAVIAERLRRNEPIELEARTVLVAALLDSLRHPHWRIRLSAVQAVCYARLVQDEPVRLLVEAMFDDPHPDVAANARKQLAHFDEIERLTARGAP